MRLLDGIVLRQDSPVQFCKSTAGELSVREMAGRKGGLSGVLQKRTIS